MQPGNSYVNGIIFFDEEFCTDIYTTWKLVNKDFETCNIYNNINIWCKNIR